MPAFPTLLHALILYRIMLTSCQCCMGLYLLYHSFSRNEEMRSVPVEYQYPVPILYRYRTWYFFLLNTVHSIWAPFEQAKTVS